MDAPTNRLEAAADPVLERRRVPSGDSDGHSTSSRTTCAVRAATSPSISLMSSPTPSVA
jgi:hypothetical protein